MEDDFEFAPGLLDTLNDLTDKYGYAGIQHALARTKDAPRPRSVPLPATYYMAASGDPVATFDYLVLELRHDGTVTWRSDKPNLDDMPNEDELEEALLDAARRSPREPMTVAGQKVLRITPPGGKPVYMRGDKSHDEIRTYWWPDAKIEEIEACGFDLGAGWADWACGNSAPCEDHANLSCVDCDQPAVFLCSSASSLVCGRPLCADHKPICRRHRG